MQHDAGKQGSVILPPGSRCETVSARTLNQTHSYPQAHDNASTHRNMDSESNPAAEGLRVRHKTGSAGDANVNANARGTKTADAVRASTDGKGKVHAQVAAAQVSDVLSLLLLFRFINSLCLRTFFQPDEYFQALEPAWSIAFGTNSGAWLTWVLLSQNTLLPCYLIADSSRNGNTN